MPETVLSVVCDTIEEIEMDLTRYFAMGLPFYLYRAYGAPQGVYVQAMAHMESKGDIVYLPVERKEAL